MVIMRAKLNVKQEGDFNFYTESNFIATNGFISSAYNREIRELDSTWRESLV